MDFEYFAKAIGCVVLIVLSIDLILVSVFGFIEWIDEFFNDDKSSKD